MKSVSIKRPEYGPDVGIRHSKRRRCIVSARTGENRIVVMVPDDLGAAAEKQQVNEIVARVWKKASSNLGNSDLERRAWLLSRTVLEDRPRFESIKWVKNILCRWVSVTGSVDSPGRIRVSHRLADVPGYVLDDVTAHELVHTFVDGGHTEKLWCWVAKTPYHEQARGYLKAYQCWGTQS